MKELKFRKVNNRYFVEKVEYYPKLLIEKIHEIFDYIGLHILDYDDEELECIIYEDYDCVISGFPNFQLEILLDSGYITEDIKHKVTEMRDLSEKMFGKGIERSATFVRNSPEWRRIIVLADQIRTLLNLPPPEQLFSP